MRHRTGVSLSFAFVLARLAVAAKGQDITDGAARKSGSGAKGRGALPLGFFFALLAAPAIAGVGQWTTNGPSNTAVVSVLAVDPSSAATVYAGTESGSIYKSTDSGQTWQPVDPNDSLLIGISALAIHPSTPSTLYAGTSAAIIESLDGGMTWSKTLDLVGASPSLPTALVVDPVNPSNLYAAHNSAWKSSDGTASWHPMALSNDIFSLVIDSVQPSTIYAGAILDFDYEGAIFKSTDAGATWIMSSNSRFFFPPITGFAINPDDHSRVYAVAQNQILSSSDAGVTWSYLPGSGPGLGVVNNISAVVVDPNVTTTLYAASNGGYGAGVYRSLDGSQSWTPFNEGLSSLDVNSFVIDQNGRFLHAGTSAGVFDFDLLPAPAGPCVAGPGTTCLLGGRFRITLFAMDDSSSRTSRGAVIAQEDRFGFFSLPDFTGDATLPEVFVKMVDATGLAPYDSFWFFHGSLTGTRYALTVTDTATGIQRIYTNDGLCGGADTKAFIASPSSATGAVAESMRKASPSGDALSLLAGRFHVSLSATNPEDGRTTTGSAIAQTDGFGYFSLPDFTGDPTFPEICVKVIDATGLTDSFWLFYTGLTSLKYTLTVTDMVTGTTRSYQNASGDPSRPCGGADTTTFLASKWDY
jgi:photosystem II stability/assembly factor-like uncharacterized protein